MSVKHIWLHKISQISLLTGFGKDVSHRFVNSCISQSYLEWWQVVPLWEMRRECCCSTSSDGIYTPRLDVPCLPASLTFLHFLDYGWDPYMNYYTFATTLIIKVHATKASGSDFSILFLDLSLKSSQKFVCLFVCLFDISIRIIVYAIPLEHLKASRIAV